MERLAEIEQRPRTAHVKRRVSNDIDGDQLSVCHMLGERN
jgi:hypothetical protein